jgi:hypothetical protein
MKERGISPDHVADVLRSPGVEKPAERENAKRYEKALSRKTRLAVIAEERPIEFWVISAWWM